MSNSDFEDSEFEYLTPLKDLSKHVCHGRIWLNSKHADDALRVIDIRRSVADILVWHNWFEKSDITYEISIAATSRIVIEEALKNIRLLSPAAHLFMCYKAAGHVIEHKDWQTF
jgi:hypothetical protein